MLLRSGLAALTAAAVAVHAATPASFVPSTEGSLIVAYAGKAASDGETFEKAATQTPPIVGTAQRLTGTYALLMIDLDIPTNAPPQTTTLLHWMQTGLSSASAETKVGAESMFALVSNSTAAAPYIGPSPPARIPLSHRYTFLLVDTTSAPASNIAALRGAARMRSGINAEAVLTSAGLAESAVAGTSIVVSNPGPVQSSGAGGRTPTAAAPGKATGLVPAQGAQGPRRQLGYSTLGLVVAAGVAIAM